MSNTIVSIPFHDAEIHALVDENGTQWVAARHVCEAAGIAWQPQHDKLRTKQWACVTQKVTHDSSGREQEMTMVDRRTFTMWLATIDTNRVKNPAARALVEALQNEAADVLDAYFNEGGAVNPRATVEQAETIAERALSLAKEQLALIDMAKNITDLAPGYVQTKVQMVIDRATGTPTHLAESDKPLYVEDFLNEKGVSGKDMKSTRAAFGRRLAVAYQVEHGQKPKKHYGEVDGRAREINYYTESDRQLMEQVWADHTVPALEVV